MVKFVLSFKCENKGLQASRIYFDCFHFTPGHNHNNFVVCRPHCIISKMVTFFFFTCFVLDFLDLKRFV